MIQMAILELIDDLAVKTLQRIADHILHGTDRGEIVLLVVLFNLVVQVILVAGGQLHCVAL